MIIYTQIDNKERFEYRLFYSELYKIYTILRINLEFLIYTWVITLFQGLFKALS